MQVRIKSETRLFIRNFFVSKLLLRIEIISNAPILSIDTITISRENCSRLFAYCPYVPITRVNLSHHEISRWVKGGGGGAARKLNHSWRSSQIHNHKSALTITWCNTVSPPFSRSHSSDVVFPRKRSPGLRGRPRKLEREGRKEIRVRSGRREMERTVEESAEPGRRLLTSREIVFVRAEWGRRGERTLHRSTACTRPMIRRVKRRVGLFDALHAPCVRVRWSCWACVLAETNSSARCLQPSQSSLRPRTFPPRRKNCPPRSWGASASRRQSSGALRREPSRVSRERSSCTLDRRRCTPRTNPGWTIRGTWTHRGWTRLNQLGNGRLLRRGPYGGAA